MPIKGNFFCTHKNRNIALSITRVLIILCSPRYFIYLPLSISVHTQCDNVTSFGSQMSVVHCHGRFVNKQHFIWHFRSKLDTRPGAHTRTHPPFVSAETIPVKLIFQLQYVHLITVQYSSVSQVPT